MTKDELQNHTHIQVHIGDKISKLEVVKEDDSLLLEGSILQGQTAYLYRRPVSQTLLDELSENEEGLIVVTHKQLLDNADEESR